MSAALHSPRLGASATPPPPASTDPAQRDHLWWLNDATRILRTAAWADLEPEHVRHLIEEIRDLQCLLDQAWACGPSAPVF